MIRTRPDCELVRMQDIFVRTQTEDYDEWFAVFSDGRPPTREEYGIRTAGVFRDTADPNIVLLHFEVDDVARMREYLARPDVERISADAGVIERTFWFGADRPDEPA